MNKAIENLHEENTELLNEMVKTVQPHRVNEGEFDRVKAQRDNLLIVMKWLVEMHDEGQLTAPNWHDARAAIAEVEPKVQADDCGCGFLHEGMCEQ